FPGNFQHYLFGASWPFPLPILAAGAASGVLSLVVGLISLRRLRSDYQAMVMLVLSLIATLTATNATGLVNGPAGLANVPQPLFDQLGLPPLEYQWVYAIWAGLLTALTFLFVRGITNSPLGRTLRAMRDNDRAAAALGKNITALRLLIFVVGGVIAGISGAVFVEFIQAWSPGSWLYPETFVFLAAIIVGGSANNWGAVDGATFTALRGRITGLIGPNGAGKSTLMGVVAGAIKPSAGRIEYDGADVTGLPPHRIARRGMVRTFQLSAEFARLTVLENL